MFHANTTGNTVLVNNTAGDEYAQDTITVNIDNPADIDDRDIICSWENGKFSDTITLQFKVYVADNLDSSQHCEGAVQLKLKRPLIQKKEGLNMEEKIKQKVIRDYTNVSEVFIDSEGFIYGCNLATTTTPIMPLLVEEEGDQDKFVAGNKSEKKEDLNIEEKVPQKLIRDYNNVSEASIDSAATTSFSGGGGGVVLD